MNYKTLNKWNTGLHDRIIKRHPNGFIGAVIQGERGQGKSMYAYKLMAKVYFTLGQYISLNDGQNYEIHTEEDAYHAALEHMIFSPHELINLFKYNNKNDIVTPVLCLDDATVHFNNYKFFVDLHEVILLKGMFDTIRTVATGLLLTCPKRRNLLSFLRDYDDLKIEIKQAPGGDNYDRFAKAYQFNYYPDDRKYRVIIPFQDKYSVFVPGNKDDENTPYGAYYKKRKSFNKSVTEKMEKIIKEKEKRTGKPAVDPRNNIILS
ncbi:MAG: hypothetical protein GF350_12015 [Chitinivibrionales bacterium]|nr:hypothetical protein [Chitinivibrionales bacterium]